MNTLAAAVRETVEACNANAKPSDDNDAFARGFSAAHRKIGAFLAGALDRDNPRDAFLAHVETLRDNATDATRREFLHRLLGSIRKV